MYSCRKASRHVEDVLITLRKVRKTLDDRPHYRTETLRKRLVDLEAEFVHIIEVENIQERLGEVDIKSREQTPSMKTGKPKTRKATAPKYEYITRFALKRKTD
jgi:broad-specificity NMP kinase